MKTFSNDRELYLAYRLGELPSAERYAIGDRLLGDGEFSDRMQEAEYDLLNDYRAGHLSSAVRFRVERAFSRAELQQPLPFASRTKDHRASVSSRPAPRFGLTFRFACAASALALAASAGWVIAVHLHSGTGTQHPVSRDSSAPSSSPQHSGKSTTPIAGASSQLPADTAVLLLAPAVTRDGSNAQLELSPVTRTITVQWLVPLELAGRTFLLSVEQNEKEIALVPASSLQHVGDSDVEEFSLPRSVFPASALHEHYIFVVRASSPAAATVAEFPVFVSADVHN